MSVIRASSPGSNGVVRVVLIAAGFVVLASPTWLQTWRGEFSAFPLVSLLCTLVIAAIIAEWKPPPPAPRALAAALPAIVWTAAAVVLVVVAAHRFVNEVLLNPPDPVRGDMLTVIEQAGRRFLRGRDPYSTYRVPWEVSLPYGPPLWAPFLVPQLLRIDLRLLTAAGQLFVPVCCGAVAALEAARGRLASAAAWIVLLSAIVFDPDLQRFVSVGHTPVYWPLLPLLAMLIVGEHWYGAAAVLGLLIAGRATMVVVVPVFLMSVWLRDRPRVLGSALVCATVAAAILLPFFVWDPGAMWSGMITKYGQIVKQVVWRSTDGGAIHTIGLTGWLLSHGLERFVEASQVCTLAAVYLLAWRALRRGHSPLPYMSLALFAFSMTALWPVYYLHFDIVLLLTAAAVAETVGPISSPRALAVWTTALVCAAGLIGATVRLMAAPVPSIAADDAAAQRLLRLGFSGLEDDGARRYRWIHADHAALSLPRSSAAAADVAVTGLPFVPPGAAPQALTAVLNGVPLGTVQAGGGWQTLRFTVPATAWRIGANDLELNSQPARSPRELGLSNDPRRLVMAVQRIDVIPR